MASINVKQEPLDISEIDSRYNIYSFFVCLWQCFHGSLGSVFNASV